MADHVRQLLPSKSGFVRGVTGLLSTVALASQPRPSSQSITTVMPSATHEIPRPRTRSMTSSAIRRSARLKGSHNKRESSLQPLPSLFVQTESDVLRGVKKRKRPSSAERESHPSNARRKKCARSEIDVPTERRPQYARSRESMASGETSVRSIKVAACNRTSSRVKELEDQLDIALQAKQELAAKVNEQKTNLAQLTLKHLEEYFACPLCFEVMACPYTLVPPNCGHTFCATCILKWFFSRLHKGCGGWHEAVDCPLCRSALPLTPERTPRSVSCFPFTPNRTADVAIRGLINTVSNELASPPPLTSAPVSDWKEGGHSKREWCKRERAGRMEMSTIATQWNTLKPTDFVNIKNRLEV